MNTIKNYFDPPQKSLPEEALDYIYNHPDQVAKGMMIGMTAWYTAPVILPIVAWAPYIGIGYYAYQNSQGASQIYHWVRRANNITNTLF